MLDQIKQKAARFDQIEKLIQDPAVLSNPAQYGALMLVFFGILKLVMLALSFKSGYIGGSTFPILFAATFGHAPIAGVHSL
jgi:H+/Cl- antiporter ClcA